MKYLTILLLGLTSYVAGTKLKIDDTTIDLSDKVVQIDGKKYVLKPSK